MVYFFHKTTPRVTLEQHDPNACHYLKIEFEYGMAHQEDGHSPWHGDSKRSFAEAVINSIDREEIAKVFKEKGIEVVRFQFGEGVTVTLSDKKDEFGLPLHKMEIVIALVPKKDIYLGLADQVIDCIHWETAKAAMNNVDKYFWYDELKKEVKNTK